MLTALMTANTPRAIHSLVSDLLRERADEADGEAGEDRDRPELTSKERARGPDSITLCEPAFVREPQGRDIVVR